MFDVKIPGPSTSTSKMSRKGWKCWAVKVSDVGSDGYFEGDRLGVGTTAPLSAGDVVLHVDESSRNSVGIVVPQRDGTACIDWIRTVTGQPSTLASITRDLVAQAPAERIARAAKATLDDAEVEWSDESKAHYESLAGSAVTNMKINLSAVSTAELIAELSRRGVKA